MNCHDSEEYESSAFLEHWEEAEEGSIAQASWNMSCHDGSRPRDPLCREDDPSAPLGQTMMKKDHVVQDDRD